jgi:phosphatidylserine/phosphatidylglycerophosphate/cardiolipin synthase-like enzyme
MLKIMANENMDDWKLGPKVIDETVRVTKKFLEEHPEEMAKIKSRMIGRKQNGQKKKPSSVSFSAGMKPVFTTPLNVSSWSMKGSSTKKPLESTPTDNTAREQVDGYYIVIVSGSPHHRRSYIRDTFLLNIASAEKEILIATPYFVPGPRMIRSLLRAARPDFPVSAGRR